MSSTASLINAVGEGDLKAAARLAAHWHGGSHREITALSHGQEWHHVAIQGELEECAGMPQGTAVEKAIADAEIEALQDFVRSHYPYVYDSTHGHTFIDSDDNGECLTCGATFDHVHTSTDDPSRGRYRASNGDDPVECTGYSLTHGEAPCSSGGHEDDESRNACAACDHDCNCLFCR